MALTSNLQSNISDISQLMSSDQSLTAKVLKLSNSPFYGRVKKVKTTQEAVLVLGFKILRSIIMATSTHRLYNKGDSRESEIKLWRHSLSTAITARQIAEHIKHPEKEEIFVAALMHDIGKLVLLQRLPEWYRKIVDEVEKNAGSFHKIESRVFHFDHSDVASLLLAGWAFPKSLVRAIARHHRPPSFRKGVAVPIAQIVNLANYMAKNLNVGFNDKRFEVLSQIKSAQAMALDEESLNLIFEESKTHYQAEVRIFEDV
jgi:putative nucleotidyltransferase with HDIG domain